MSTLTHFYSYTTGVSLELPVGFTRVEETANSASYAMLDADDNVTLDSPALHVQVVGAVPEADPDGHASAAHVADRLAAAGTVLRRSDQIVDECPVFTVEVERDGTYLHLSAAAADGRLISLAGRGPRDSAPIWDAALSSLRFITL